MIARGVPASRAGSPPCCGALMPPSSPDRVSHVTREVESRVTQASQGPGETLRGAGHGLRFRHGEHLETPGAVAPAGTCVRSGGRRSDGRGGMSGVRVALPLVV